MVTQAVQLIISSFFRLFNDDLAIIIKAFQTYFLVLGLMRWSAWVTIPFSQEHPQTDSYLEQPVTCCFILFSTLVFSSSFSSFGPSTSMGGKGG